MNAEPLNREPLNLFPRPPWSTAPNVIATSPALIASALMPTHPSTDDTAIGAQGDPATASSPTATTALLASRGSQGAEVHSLSSAPRRAHPLADATILTEWAFKPRAMRDILVDALRAAVRGDFSALDLRHRGADAQGGTGIAGSVIRQLLNHGIIAPVGDIELLFIPKSGLRQVPPDLFPRVVSLADLQFDALLRSGVLVKRPNKNGATAWGEKNKLAIHAASGIPVDLFTATRENWFNYLVCRTGGAETNKRIAMAAQPRGWKWEPKSAGFLNLAYKPRFVVRPEQDVFLCAGLDYLEPEARP